MQIQECFDFVSIAKDQLYTQAYL